MKRVCWGFGDSLDQEFYAENEGFFVCFVSIFSSSFFFFFFLLRKQPGVTLKRVLD